MGLPVSRGDKQGRTVDFLLSKRRDVAAAKRFFSHATKEHKPPRGITLDAYAASHRAVSQLKEIGRLPRRVQIRSSKYLNKRSRARPSPDQTANPTDAWIQAIRDCDRNDSRH